EWRDAVTDAETAIHQIQSASAGSTIEDARADQAQALFNAARIYALAVEFAAQKVSRHGERAVVLYRRYRTRARDLLEEALDRVPDPERRQELLSDPALRPLHLRPSRSPAVSGRAAVSIPPLRRGGSGG